MLSSSEITELWLPFSCGVFKYIALFVCKTKSDWAFVQGQSLTKKSVQLFQQTFAQLFSSSHSSRGKHIQFIVTPREAFSEHAATKKPIFVAYKSWRSRVDKGRNNWIFADVFKAKWSHIPTTRVQPERKIIKKFK